eukprot:6211917-Pleurochrysis_carterae.AAC.2
MDRSPHGVQHSDSRSRCRLPVDHSLPFSAVFFDWRRHERSRGLKHSQGALARFARIVVILLLVEAADLDRSRGLHSIC